MKSTLLEGVPSTQIERRVRAPGFQAANAPQNLVFARFE
jgi:hypothetical protein